MTFDTFSELLAAPIWWSYLLRIVFFYVLAWVAHRVSNSRFGRMRLLWRQDNKADKFDRTQTTRHLVSSFITILAFLAATILSLAQFIPLENLVWTIGLFATGFGLALMPLLRDIFTGITFLFENAFDVGENVELVMQDPIQGVVEHVNLRTTAIRARSGELYSVPNGEIRIVRNFSRGHFSTADIVIMIKSEDLAQAIITIEQVQQNALHQLPDLVEPIKIISEEGRMGSGVELKLVAKARFGKAAELRPKLLAFIHAELQKVGIELSV